MKSFSIHILFLGLAFGAFAQTDGPKGYFFDGDEVVFEFNVEEYKQVTKDQSQRRLDFEDLKIQEVAVSGDFNNWSREGWKMKKISENIYQVRKPITDFDDEFNWEFKFFINGRYWAEPQANFVNKVYANNFWEETYNLRLFDIEPDPKGNAVFYLSGFEDAQSVILSGDFVGWHEQYLKMEKVDEGWELRLNLDAGKYEYKFIIDGEWILDPDNPHRTANHYGTDNSVKIIKEWVSFCLQGYEEADQVTLAGSFNNWDPNGIFMKWNGDHWEYSVKLHGGKHFYKFVVDGEWIVDPNNPIKENDGQGNINSVLFVQ